MLVEQMPSTNICKDTEASCVLNIDRKLYQSRMSTSHYCWQRSSSSDVHLEASQARRHGHVHGLCQRLGCLFGAGALGLAHSQRHKLLHPPRLLALNLLQQLRSQSPQNTYSTCRQSMSTSGMLAQVLHGMFVSCCCQRSQTHERLLLLAGTMAQDQQATAATAPIAATATVTSSVELLKLAAAQCCRTISCVACCRTWLSRSADGSRWLRSWSHCRGREACQ
jgi:hypothetical protein